MAVRRKEKHDKLAYGVASPSKGGASCEMDIVVESTGAPTAAVTTPAQDAEAKSLEEFRSNLRVTRQVCSSMQR